MDEYYRNIQEKQKVIDGLMDKVVKLTQEKAEIYKLLLGFQKAYDSRGGGCDILARQIQELTEKIKD